MSQNTSSAVMQRADAIALGLKAYFTGLPCPRGHIAKRSVSNSDCRACVNERTRRRREADPEPFRSRDRARYHDDVEASRLEGRLSREKNIEKRRAYDHHRYHNDPARKASTKARAFVWGKKNKGKRNRIVAARRWWIKRATPPWLTTEQRAEIAALYLDAARRGESVDHIYPLRAKNSCGLHVPWNLQIMPTLDNIRKGNRFDGAE